MQTTAAAPIGADDQAMAAALVDLSGGLGNIYERTIDRLETVERQLKDLDARNGKLADFLLRSQSTLAKVDLLVVPAASDRYAADLRDDIGPTIARWREAAMTGPPAAPETFAALYKDFRRQARRLAGEGAGVFPAYGQVMAFEYLTGALIKASKAERLAAFDQYVAQWGFFLDPKDPASILSAAMRKKTLRSQMEGLLQAGDAILAQNRRFVVSKNQRVACAGGAGYWQDLIAEVQGDRTAGYRYSETRVRTGDFDDGAALDFGNAAALLGSVAVDRSWGDVAAKVALLEEVRLALASLPTRQALAETLLKAANQYAAAAQKWRDAIQAAP